MSFVSQPAQPLKQVLQRRIVRLLIDLKHRLARDILSGPCLLDRVLALHIAIQRPALSLHVDLVHGHHHVDVFCLGPGQVKDLALVRSLLGDRPKREPQQNGISPPFFIRVVSSSGLNLIHLLAERLRRLHIFCCQETFHLGARSPIFARVQFSSQLSMPRFCAIIAMEMDIG